MKYKGFDTKNYNDPKFWLVAGIIILIVFLLDKLF